MKEHKDYDEISEMIGVSCSSRVRRTLKRIQADECCEDTLQQRMYNSNCELYREMLLFVESIGSHRITPVQIVKNIHCQHHLHHQIKRSSNDCQASSSRVVKVDELHNEVEDELGDLGEEKTKQSLLDDNSVVLDELGEVEETDGRPGGEIDVAVLVGVIAQLAALDSAVAFFHQVHVFVLLEIQQHILTIFPKNVNSIGNVLLVPTVPHNHTFCLQLLHHLLQIARLLV